MKQWFASTELAGLQGVPGTERGVLKMAARQSWTSRRKTQGKGREYALASLPPITQAALLIKYPPTSSSSPLSSGPSRLAHQVTTTSPLPSKATASGASFNREESWDRYERQPNKAKDVAQLRLQHCQAVAALIDHGHKVTDALDAVATQTSTPRATLARWWYSLDGIHRSDWLPALLPRYSGRQPDADCSPEAWDFFKADWLRLEAPAAQACYERLNRAAKHNGWTVPSLRTLQRRIEREIPATIVIMARKGMEAHSRTMPPQERDHSVFKALEAVNADGHKFDVFCRWPDGVVQRPVMLAWQDIYSGKILSYRVDQTEHSGLVRLSFGDLVERYGIPEHAWLDNGRGFASKLISGGISTRYRFKIREEDPDGILKNMGVKVHWATPYHGQAKPIERAFRDLCEYVAKHTAFTGAYTGNNPTAKPENYGSRAVPIQDFMRVLETEINAHNARPGRTSKVCAKRSFDEAFNQSYACSAPRKPTIEQRRLWLLAAEGKKLASNNGSLMIMGNRYWSEKLAQNAGISVIARFDPDALHAGVHVYTLDGRYIDFAKCDEARGFADTKSGRAHSQATKLYKRTQKQMLTAERRMTALEAAAQLPEMLQPDVPETKVVRLVPMSSGSAALAIAADALVERGCDPNEEQFMRTTEEFYAPFERKLRDRL